MDELNSAFPSGQLTVLSALFRVFNAPGFPASEIVFAEDNSFLREELLVLELFYKERINMTLLKVLLPFQYHDFRLMTLILQEQWLSVRRILFNSYKKLTEDYEVTEEALVQKQHKPGESRNSIRVAFCFTQRSTKVKKVVQQPIRVRDLLAKFLTSPGYVLLFSQTDLLL